MNQILLLLKLLLNMLIMYVANDNDIDYEDILDNLDDYEYPYNYINREGV